MSVVLRSQSADQVILINRGWDAGRCNTSLMRSIRTSLPAAILQLPKREMLWHVYLSLKVCIYAQGRWRNIVDYLKLLTRSVWKYLFQKIKVWFCSLCRVSSSAVSQPEPCDDKGLVRCACRLYLVVICCSCSSHKCHCGSPCRWTY